MNQLKLAQRLLSTNWIRPFQLTALLTFGFVALQPTVPAAQAMARQTAIQLAMASAVPLPRASGVQLEEGIHFFGESEQRDQLGSTYMIFEVNNAEVVGAVYAPHSSYSCFEGRFSNDQLALRIDDPYGDEVFLHEIALEPQAMTIAAGEGISSIGVQMGLEGMTALSGIQAEEQDLLLSCKAELL